MIGGRDIIIPTAQGGAALNLAVRAASRFWPEAVLEDAETGENLHRDADITLTGRREMLVFRDPQSARLWDELGAEPSLDGTLIHFIFAAKELTICIDADPSPEIQSSAWLRPVTHSTSHRVQTKLIG